MTPLSKHNAANPLRSECGQSHILGFAICFPVVLIALFFLAGLCWLGWQNVSFGHALYQTSWSMSATKLDQSLVSVKPNDLVRDMIAADWTTLDNQSLVVRNAAIDDVSVHEKEELGSKQDHESLRIERADASVRFAKITADVTYTVKLPFPLPGIDSISLTRHIDKTKQITSRFEVS